MGRLLVVDDDSNQLSAVRRIFFDSAHELAFLQDGRQVFSYLEDFRPDLVILDLLMPDSDGYEFCRQIKIHTADQSPMVLIVSGKSGLEDRLKGYEVFADDFIAKPYEPAELKAKVLILLRLKTAQDELRRLNAGLEQLVQERTRELIRSERSALVGEMLHGIVHNFQSPLGVIGSSLDMALNSLEVCLQQVEPGVREMAARLKRDLDLMRQALERIDAMIAGLLTHGSASARLGSEPVDLNALLRRELDFLSGNLELKHEVLTQFALDSDLPPLKLAYSDLAQVVGNLVNNAVDAMREMPRKELVIATHQDRDSVYLDFRDTGCGIAPEIAERIFDPFFSTKSRREANCGGGGTGLGLHISRQLVAAMGGGIQVKSAPGEGAVFSLRLPKPAN